MIHSVRTQKARLLSVAKPHHALSKQKGLSLISLLIGILMSTWLIYSIQDLYLSSMKSKDYNSAQGALHDSGRNVTSVLRRMAVHAGLGIGDGQGQVAAALALNQAKAQNPNDYFDLTTFQFDGLSVLDSNDIQNGDKHNIGDNINLNIGDVIVMRYLRTGGCDTPVSNTPGTQDITDGGGNAVTVSQFQPTEVVIKLTQNNDLQCRVRAPGSGNNFQTFMDNIYGFRVLYGLDQNNDTFPDQYVGFEDFDGMSQQAKLNAERQIRTVRMAVLASSGPFLVSQADARQGNQATYQLLDRPITINLNTNNNDRRLFGVYETTIYLPNMNR